MAACPAVRLGERRLVRSLLGLLINLLGAVGFARAMVLGILWGVAFGLVFAAVGYAMTRGRGDFTSRSATIPSHFDVMVSTTHSLRAQAVLAGPAA
ncbi:hypothetical protein OOJ91_09090 [Micromonospora lupini]|uniref:hypothetical protein n=1 Tax=Micromonospora lupini TaxID=285679 RepID=UPI002254A6DA|nr:hypothetical protein [Micromonospora lupini]MCX5066037.1 hypothetical protein [Micromonospora lupini]